MNTPPLPLFDTLNKLHKNHEIVCLSDPARREDFMRTLNFLKCYTGSTGTFNSYRRETERLLHWCWSIKNITLKDVKREHIEQYLNFCQNPLKSWISLKKVPRFIEKDGKRQANEAWRPFVAKISKSAKMQGQSAAIEDFSLSQGAVQEIFAILSTFFNFLIAEEFLHANPIALIRQKSKFIRKRQQHAPVRRLSLVQWQAVLQGADKLATDNPAMHERTRFILNLLFGMYLRISEVVASERWIPSMNDFAKDAQGCWWFTTIGKGNKERQVAVSDAMLRSLIRWRQFLGLTPLPTPADNSPLIPKIRGNGPMSDTAPIRRLIQSCFNAGELILRQEGKNEEADHLMAATVHWLRHTGISEDVRTRPREHVRDDAGHSSSATTDRYIDVEKAARHQSARQKLIEVTQKD